jgi:hypothetical protein
MPKKNGRARHMAEVNAKRRKQQDATIAQIEEGMDELQSEEAVGAALSDTDAEDAELEDEMVMEVVDEGPATKSGDAAAGQAARRARESEARRRSRGEAVSGKKNDGTLARMFGKPSWPPADAAPLTGVAPPAEAGAAGPTAPAIRRGRPPGSHSSGKGSNGSSAASHGGVKPGSIGGNPTTSNRQRASIRQAAAAAAAVIRGDERPGPSLEAAPRRRSHAWTSNGPQLLARGLEPEFALRLKAVASRRCFQQEDFVDGPAMSKAQWLQLEQEQWELRRAYAMAHFARLRDDGHAVASALQVAAGGVFYWDEGVLEHTLSETTLRRWLTDYIKQDGWLVPAQRGRHAKNESYLSDQLVPK